MPPPPLERVLNSRNRSKWEDPSFWRGLCADLSIEGRDGRGAQAPAQAPVQAPDGNRRRPLAASAEECRRRRERLVGDGYALADDPIASEEAVRGLAGAVTALHCDRGLPATFVLLYDEAWDVARAASEALEASASPANRFNFDVLAWYVDPREGVAGFSPHRDRQPELVGQTFHPDGMAKYATQWLALTDATPENSCLYVIPRQFDPGYEEGDDACDCDCDGDGDGDGNGDGDPLSRALCTKESYQNIRSLPRLAGQSVLFTHRILHWGSRGNPHSHLTTPRIAMSFVCSDPAFERPYLAASLAESIPPFRTRLLLVCAQLLIYYQRFDLPKACVKACYEYVKENGSALDEGYRKKVYVEFVKAMREDAPGPDPSAERDTKSLGGDGPNHHNDADPDDDDDDAVLKEMLEAEAEGYGEFEDDFDEIAGSDGELGNRTGHNMSDEDDLEEEDDEPGLLFGKRRDAESANFPDSSKRHKA